GICSYNSDFYGYNMYFDENSFTSKVFDNPLITNANPIINSPSNQWLLANGFESDGSVGLFGVFESETDEGSIYSLYHFSITDNQAYIVSTSNAGLIYFPFFSQNDSIYFADVTNGIYSVNTSNISNSPATFKIETIVEYSDLVLPATDVYNCTAQPIVGGANNSTLWFSLQLPNVQPSETYICVYNTVISFSDFVLVSDTITLPLGADSNNNVYAVGANTLYAYDASLYQIGQVTLPSTPNGFSQPIVGNGIVAVALDNGILCLYTSSLELIAQINVDDQIVAVPVMNGDKISVGGYNTEKNQYTVYTYNTAGLLATTPYVTSATSSLNIAAYYNGLPLPVTPSSSALNLTIDGTQFSQITLGVPSTTLNMGSYSVSWDSDTNQFSLTGPNITVDSVTVAGTQGNWLFVLVNPYLYFYADGQQIFAIPLELDALPTGNFTITADDNALSCRDIVLINDPSLQISYHDGANKVRQVQHMADVVLPQQSNQGV
ncbi:MAG TPA: hypothetical protein PKE52_04480, partial [Bacteroidales bacterium]|nr:hypothetical protein [Bacteroidales bacterium]